ncbi:TPA: S-adenosylmethionine decarboxylase [Pseudomonas aeruginosa]|nr:S-adenosylmethionine decarboxylase [Pseudomonas aeruginosa]
MFLLTAKYLGRHVLAEFWRCQRVDDPKRVERALVIAAQAAGATVLQTNLHHFGERESLCWPSPTLAFIHGPRSNTQQLISFCAARQQAIPQQSSPLQRDSACLL